MLVMACQGANASSLDLGIPSCGLHKITRGINYLKLAQNLERTISVGFKPRSLSFRGRHCPLKLLAQKRWQQILRFAPGNLQRK